jgi:SOS-response transcriptional repressor LexA
MSPAGLAKWLSDALKQSGISQAELARQLSRQLGRDIDRAAVNKMCIVLEKSGQKRRRIAADELLAIAEITGVPAPHVETTGAIPVPILSWVSAGQLADASSQIPVEDLQLLAFADLGHGDFFALRVTGDSMDRVSPENSVIVVNRADQALVSGKLYVFAIKGETTYKAWQAGEPDYLAPLSTNPAHRPIFFKKGDLIVIGRVCRSVIDL